MTEAYGGSPRPRGACLNADGSQKPAYRSRKVARDVARTAKKKYGNKLLSAYLCETGLHYHVGQNIKRLHGMSNYPGHGGQVDSGNDSAA